MNKTILIFSLIAVLGVIGAGYFLLSTTSDEESNESTQQEVAEVSAYSLEDIALHATADDCWMAVNGKVYDVSQFISTHPGGDSIVSGCGIDATELFETRPTGSGTPHSSSARSLLSDYYIGDLK